MPEHEHGSEQGILGGAFDIRRPVHIECDPADVRFVGQARRQELEGNSAANLRRGLARLGGRSRHEIAEGHRLPA